MSRIGLIEDCDDDVMDEVSRMTSVGRHLSQLPFQAKMEFLFLATSARVCTNVEAAARGRQAENIKGGA